MDGRGGCVGIWGGHDNAALACGMLACTGHCDVEDNSHMMSERNGSRCLGMHRFDLICN